ncbi:SidA/IucD/PvdA family monooxygenase [Streptomyces sp. 3MP-14]|uniref:L-lysine N6-monooxygenase MbtG n=1 Tax=Streptomyces mimosae TaxID=2586635 RepID=A0A5N5ZWQ8_9ACTN|nr:MULTISPECIES: SidA/IucD/PvdA family monooxygenase [Streptomyces]KAB8159478.1 SidA/IucD/PvdA family monooxygenase [Streptomyces mimosae]KAB8172634.1 SidA/IucD/PvdA family monooxygenase [Streptomyces sp. 3MP-14]
MTEPDLDLDLAAVGIGPFNLALTALADEVPELRFAAFDRRERYDWHPGLMFDWASLQVGFLADLVSLIRPTSRWSFLNYLVEHDRMYPFYIAERFHVPRREYADYCAWAAARLPGCHFGVDVTEVTWDEAAERWVLTLREVATGTVSTRRARHLVLGVGTEPALPEPLRRLAGEASGQRVFHSGEFLHRIDAVAEAGARSVTVVGSGQSGAEVFLDLLRRQRDAGWALNWLTRSWGFAPLDYSKLVLEYTTPAYMRYFNALPPATRDRLIASQWQLYKGIDTETIDLIHQELYDHLLDGDRPPVTLLPATAVRGADLADGGTASADGGTASADGGTASADGGAIRLTTWHADTEREAVLATDAVIAATGYAARRPDCLAPVEKLIAWDEHGRYDVSEGHRVATVPEVTGGLFVQNAELHTHGAAAPDLGIGAYRSALILNAVAGRDVFRIPRSTAFQTFGSPGSPGSPAGPPATPPATPPAGG